MLYENEDFDNIFKAAWFVIVTLSTVGYGDISPESTLGKLLTVPIIVAGILFMAMPISIVGNNFTVIWEERQVLFVVTKIRSLLEHRHLEQEHAVQVFREMDADGDGSLDLQEFRRALSVMGINLYSRQLTETFQAFDGDMNGTVNYEEFCERVFPDTGGSSVGGWVKGVFSSRDDSSNKESVTYQVNKPGTQPEPPQAVPVSDLMDTITNEARKAAKELKANRWSPADRFAMSAPKRLDHIQENLNRIAAHLGVELLQYDEETEFAMQALVAVPKPPSATLTRSNTTGTNV
jgi:hypothetical protein